MQANKKKTLFNSLMHLIFWAGVCYFFTHFSSLRPGGGLYKEFVSVLFIMAMVYLNYFCLIPKFFQTGKLKQYWLFALLSIVIAGVGEFILVLPEIRKCSNSTPLDLIPTVFRTFLFLIILRDFGFFLFFFLLRLYNDLIIRHIREKQMISAATQAIFIPLKNGAMKEVKISEIVYISQEKNYSYFYLINGMRYHQYSSLSETEQLFPENTCLRINKSILVILSNVVSYNKTSIQVNLKEKGLPVTLKISEKYRDTVLSTLSKHKDQMLQNESNPNVKNNNGSGVKRWSNRKNNTPKEEKYGVKLQNITFENHVVSPITENSPQQISKVLESVELHKTSKAILNFIKDYNNDVTKNKKGCRVPTIAEGINLAQRTIETHIIILKEHHLIEYRGAPRNGGYYVVEEFYEKQDK